MTQQTVYVATPQDPKRFERKDPAEVQKTLEEEGFDFREISMSHFLLHYTEGEQQRSLIFGRGFRVGEDIDKTTATLGQLIDIYNPCVPSEVSIELPGEDYGSGRENPPINVSDFKPPYVALVQEDLYESVQGEFEKKGWGVERIVNAE